MSQSAFAAQAAVRRRSQVFTGVLGLFAALLLGLICRDMLPVLHERLHLFHMGTRVYRNAQWASTVSLFSFLSGAAALSVWLFGRFLRQALGLPPRQHTDGTRLWFTVRVIAAFPLLIWLSLWAEDEFLVRHVVGAPLLALLLGLFLCLMFAYDVPRLLRNAASALCARGPLLGVRFRELRALPAQAQERVHVRGTVVDAGTTLPSLLGDCVYRRSLSQEDGLERVQAVPFFLEDQGHRAFVQVDPDRLIVETRQGEQWEAVLRVGARVHVVGSVSAQGGAYRGEAHLGAGPGETPLFILAGATDADAGGRSMGRRLVVAAAVELLSALGLLACTAGLLGFWIHAGRLAHLSR